MPLGRSPKPQLAERKFAVFSAVQRILLIPALGRDHGVGIRLPSMRLRKNLELRIWSPLAVMLAKFGGFASFFAGRFSIHPPGASGRLVLAARSENLWRG